jgi:hypothetical protein
MSNASQAINGASAYHGILKAPVLLQTFERFNAIVQIFKRM